MSLHAQLSARDISGPITQLLTNLQSEQGHVWLGALKALNRKEEFWSRLAEIKIWKTITLGYFPRPFNFFSGLEESGCRVQVSESYFRRMERCEQGVEVDLVKVSLTELGLAEGSGTDAIYRRANEFNLAFCSREMVLSLSLEARVLDLSNPLYFAMSGISITDSLEILALRKWDKVPVLFSTPLHKGRNQSWKATDRFVFTKPRR
jgi:hypothetical protein